MRNGRMKKNALIVAGQSSRHDGRLKKPVDKLFLPKHEDAKILTRRQRSSKMILSLKSTPPTLDWRSWNFINSSYCKQLLIRTTDRFVGLHSAKIALCLGNIESLYLPGTGTGVEVSLFLLFVFFFLERNGFLAYSFTPSSRRLAYTALYHLHCCFKCLIGLLCYPWHWNLHINSSESAATFGLCLLALKFLSSGGTKLTDFFHRTSVHKNVSR